MANNDLSSSENILIKIDENNLIYVDPNSVLENGEIKPRGVKEENLVMYANLEADIIPRTRLISDSQSTLRNVSSGTLNFLSKQKGDRDFDTSWTESYVGSDVYNDKGEYVKNDVNSSDSSGQSFGISSISIQVKGTNFIPQITIEFIDVRGKTLFESPDDSPYKTFFHIPWPIFYLTIKGYYGKAIRYRLHLVSFSSRFNQSTGNFEITAKFVGSTYAYLNEIPLKAVMNSPYMFMRTIEGSETFNERTGFYEKKALKSSKGYQILKSVYSEMKSKKLISDDFPVKTLREICSIATTLDKKLEQQIFDQVIDPKVLDGLRSYSEVLNNFETAINGWKNRNIDLNNFFDDPTQLTRAYTLKTKPGLNAKDDLSLVTGSTENKTLEYLITLYTNEIKKYQKTFNDNVKNNRNESYSVSVNTKILSNSLPSIGSYYFKTNNNPSVYYILIDKLISDIQNLKKTFFEENSKIEKEIERKMNDIIKNPNTGFGFEPTIRNLFGVLLANAEVYVRLMKDVHQDAFNVANDRKKYIENFTDESVGEAIYPWPEIKKVVPGDNNKVIAYPGEPELQDKLKSFNSLIWPEVSFLEEFVAVSTNVKDPLVEKEGGVNDLEYVFESDLDNNKINEISPLFQISSITPYSNRTQVSFIYEIYERAKQITLIDSFDPKTINDLVGAEFDTIQNVVSEETDILNFLKTQIKSLDELKSLMEEVSKYEKYRYYLESIPTTEYISNILNKPFLIKQYIKNESDTKKYDFSRYENLNNYLLNYTPESYRKNIFPFNSSTYLNYINKNSFINDEFKFKGLFKVGVENELISTPVITQKWLKNNLTIDNNLFTNKLHNGENETNILNTPYFHKQLYSDFKKTTSFAKYTGSAYLLLNSLPYHDLKDEINFGGVIGNIRVSLMFREISGTHHVPYYLILKWGSLYHRYKKKIIDGVDILNGFVTSDSDTTTTNIDGNEFFNNNQTGTTFETFTFDSTNITYGDNTDVGIHPFYDAIFHQVVNGYNHYVVTSGDTSFNANTLNGTIKGKKRPKENGLNYWSQFVDNSKFDPTDLRYTLLPCDGYNKNVNLKTNSLSSDFNFNESEQMNYRIIWDDEYIKETFSGKTFSTPYEYNNGVSSGIFEIKDDQEKVYDLIATFSPKILEEFENLFLLFSSENVIIEGSDTIFKNIKYDNFQKLLKEIVSVKKYSTDSSNIEENLIKIKNEQKNRLLSLSQEIVSENYLLKFSIGNPKEFDSYVLDNYVKDTSIWGTYDSLTQSVNTKYITLYVGENPDSGIDYLNFFSVSDIALTEENVLLFRPLILIYGGYIKNGGTNNKTNFVTYIKENILDKLTTSNEVGGSNNRLNLFLTNLIQRFTSLTLNKDDSVSFIDGYNNRTLKVELYNTFKSFNDKWIAGNSIGQRLLFEEFLFLDRANRDIGNKTYLNIGRFVSLFDTKNDDINLYSAISLLLQGTGFDMRALPSYVNFYGNNIKNRSKITPSKNVADNVFGTFLDVDYVDSSPKIIIQFVGQSSKHIADGDKRTNKFNDDSFDISVRNKNPLIVTLPQIYDVDELNKSNRVVAFEVSFGDQNQNIFKGVTLDQTTLKNTSESFVVLENLARSESGAGTYSVDTSLFDYYKQASYSCEVTMMGNVMIQPTMYFYLKNIPMFRGTYWITEVSHSIRNNTIETSFKGTRIPVAALPNLEDSFISSYKSLLDKIISSAKNRVKKINQTNTTTEQIIKTDNGDYIIDLGGIQIQNETLISSAGITEFGIPYNGFGNEKYIQKVSYKQSNGQTSEWFRAKVCRMGSDIYEISDDNHMSLLTKLRNSVNVDSNGNTGLKWGELKFYTNSLFFYSTKFLLINSITADKIITGETEFLNPNVKGGNIVTLKPSYSLDRTVSNLNVSGPVNIGPFVDNYGIGLSNRLMKILKINEGEILYFRIK